MATGMGCGTYSAQSTGGTDGCLALSYYSSIRALQYQLESVSCDGPSGGDGGV